MPGSLNLTAAEAFQGYVRTYDERLFRQLFYGFDTAQLATPHEGIKGQKIITELQVAANLAKRWNRAFAPPTDQVDFKPVTLSTTLNKVEHSVVPQDYEATYLGMMRRTGQNPDDYPFEMYIMEILFAKLNQEQEFAIWQGEAASSPSSNDYLRQTFDGYLTLIKDAITATDITPVVTGAITSSNAVDKFRLMWAEVDQAYKRAGMDIFCDYTIYDNYRIHYKEKFGANPVETPVINNADYTLAGLRYELGGGNTYIIPIAGMEGSGRVVITPRSNLHYGFDALSDWENFNFEQDHRNLDFWLDFRMGAQILTKRDGILVVNDQE